jgi:hypothetical protein
MATNPLRGPIAARNVIIALFKILVRREKIRKRSKFPFTIKNSDKKFVNGYPLNKGRKSMGKEKSMSNLSLVISNITVALIAFP